MQARCLVCLSASEAYLCSFGWERETDTEVPRRLPRTRAVRERAWTPLHSIPRSMLTAMRLASMHGQLTSCSSAQASLLSGLVSPHVCACHDMVLVRGISEHVLYHLECSPCSIHPDLKGKRLGSQNITRSERKISGNKSSLFRRVQEHALRTSHAVNETSQAKKVTSLYTCVCYLPLRRQDALPICLPSHMTKSKNDRIRCNHSRAGQGIGKQEAEEGREEVEEMKVNKKK